MPANNRDAVVNPWRLEPYLSQMEWSNTRMGRYMPREGEERMVRTPSRLDWEEGPPVDAPTACVAVDTPTPQEGIIGQVFNTPQGIHECLCYLYHEVFIHSRLRYQVSIVFGSGSGQVCIGDKLELADPVTNKVRKKRWWERYKGTENQLRLPFPCYQPAKFCHITFGEFSLTHVLDIEYQTDQGDCSASPCFCRSEGLLDESPLSIKAIKIHCVEGYNPSLPVTAPQPTSRGRCSTIADFAEAEDALQAGLRITTDCCVFNKETGTCVGTEFESHRDVDREVTNGSFRMLNGDWFHFFVPDSVVSTFDFVITR